MNNVEIKHLVSKRDISIEAFELVNGNLMLESALLDTYHLIRLNLHVDPHTKTIVHAECEYANHPHKSCPVVALKAGLLVGLQLQRGIIKEVIKRVGGGDGCVHLRELVIETINFAATNLLGYDEGLGLMDRSFNLLDENQRYEKSKELLKNTCYVYKEK